LQFRACLDGYSCQIAMEAWMNFANHIQDYYNDALHGQFMVAKDRIEIRLSDRFLQLFYNLGRH